MKVKKNYPVIDILRIVFVMLIVINFVGLMGSKSVGVLGDINDIFDNWVARLGFPFFFLCAGFFIFRADVKADFAYTKKKAWNFLRLYLLWSLIYLPLAIVIAIHTKGGFGKGLLELLQNFFFKGTVDHLWFLRSCAVAILIVGGLLYLRWKPLHIVLLGCATYLVGLLFQGYFFLVHPIEKISFFSVLMDVLRATVGTTRNGVFFGFVYVALGMFLARVKIKLPKNLCLGLSIASFALLLGEILLLRLITEKNADFYLMSVPTMFFLFAYIVQIKVKEEMDFGNVKDISAWIYFVHFGIYAIMQEIFSNVLPIANLTPILLLVVIALSFGLSLLLTNLSKEHSWLERLK